MSGPGQTAASNSSRKAEHYPSLLYRQPPGEFGQVSYKEIAVKQLSHEQLIVEATRLIGPVHQSDSKAHLEVIYWI